MQTALPALMKNNFVLAYEQQQCQVVFLHVKYTYAKKSMMWFRGGEFNNFLTEFLLFSRFFSLQDLLPSINHILNFALPSRG